MAELSPPAAITALRLQRFAGRCDYVALAPRLQRAASRAEINTARRVAHWLAHIYVESQGLLRFVENLNYSAEGLAATWPSRFPPAVAQGFAHDQEAIANKVYGGRMGNDEAGDGFRYIGRGPLMRTGKAGYQLATAAARRRGATYDQARQCAVDFVKYPNLLALPEYGFEDAADFWADHGLNQVADADAGEVIHATIQEAVMGNECDDLVAETQAINGGQIGYAQRKVALLKARTVWVDG